MRKLIFAVLWVLLPLTAIGQPELDIERVTGFDVTAWSVTVSGDLLFVAAGQNGFNIYDVSDPHQPELIRGYETPGNAVAVAVNGDYAYVVDEGEGVRVFNISQPGNASELAPYDFEGWASFCISIDHNVACIGYSSGGMRIADISNPASIQTLHVIDGEGWEGVGWGGIEFGVAVADGRYVYILTGVGIRVLDIQAQQRGNDCQLPNGGRGVVINGNYAYVAGQASGVNIIDISQRMSQRLLSTTGSPGSAQGVCIQGTQLFVAESGSGFRIFDISDPTHPVLDGQCDTEGDARGIAAKEDIAYVADMRECGAYWFHPPFEPEISCSDEQGNELGPQHSLSFDAEIDQVHQRTITIRNDGEEGSILIVSELEVTGEDRANFELGQLNPAEIPAGESSELTIGFRPQRVGDFTAQLEISCSDEDEASFSIPLIGTGVPIDGVVSEENGVFPNQFGIISHFPNPFNSSTTISYSLPAAGRVTLGLYDLSGRLVVDLVDEVDKSGRHSVVLDAKDLPTGLYLVRLEAGGVVKTGKAALVK